MSPTLMPAAIAFAVIFLLRCIHTAMYGRFRRDCTCKRNHIHIQDLSKATAILKSSTLQSRALPNQRLVSVFFISNAFTTTDQVVYSSFLAEAKDLLKTSNDDFFGLAHDTLRLTRDISSVPSTKPIQLNSLIQVVCFRFVLLKFFPSTTVVPSSDSSIPGITELINELWISSKCSCSFDGSHVSKQDLLQHEIDLLFPHLKNGNDENPLNIILPAYETLWRVVLRCFLEVSFLKLSDVATQWKKIIHDFLRILCLNLSDYIRQQKEYIVKTRRMDGSPKEAWMPFGNGSFRCPAKKVAPMMIAMLVGCLVETFGNGQWVLEDVCGDNEIFRGQPLDNGRDAFGSVFLRRVEVS